MQDDIALWQAEPAMASRFFTQLLRRRTWAEALYALLGLPLGVAGFVYVVTTLAVSGGLLITFVGLPLMAITVLIGRHLGSGGRIFANKLIGTDVPPPQRFRANPGLLGWIGSCLTDGTAWRAQLYLLLKLPLGVASFVSTVVLYSYGFGGLTYAIWRPFLPCNYSTPGHVCHRAAAIGDNRFLDTPFRIFLTALAGLVLLLIAPWVVRGVVYLDRLAMRLLLGPTGRADRVAELEHSRAVAVDDSAATLRRIERDLHDGAQAKLVALAMNVGLAREKLAEGGDPAEATRLLDTAHTTAKQAITELRDLARGIHPPVLDAGLDAALATLAAHSVVPVQLASAITDRPDPAIETMVYFCAAELLTNVAKHSGARHAQVDTRTVDGWLRLQVHDDGRGGARIGGGSGLAGLRDRIGTVDGRIYLESPDGGPTTVTVDVPLRAGRR